eukprot:2137147-Alexandrium_andersonii.AAC.1
MCRLRKPSAAAKSALACYSIAGRLGGETGAPALEPTGRCLQFLGKAQIPPGQVSTFCSQCEARRAKTSHQPTN